MAEWLTRSALQSKHRDWASPPASCSWCDVLFYVSQAIRLSTVFTFSSHTKAVRHWSEGRGIAHPVCKSLYMIHVIFAFRLLCFALLSLLFSYVTGYKHMVPLGPIMGRGLIVPLGPEGQGVIKMHYKKKKKKEECSWSGHQYLSWNCRCVPDTTRHDTISLLLLNRWRSSGFGCGRWSSRCPLSMIVWWDLGTFSISSIICSIRICLSSFANNSSWRSDPYWICSLM